MRCIRGHKRFYSISWCLGKELKNVKTTFFYIYSKPKRNILLCFLSSDALNFLPCLLRTCKTIDFMIFLFLFAGSVRLHSWPKNSNRRFSWFFVHKYFLGSWTRFGTPFYIFANAKFRPISVQLILHMFNWCPFWATVFDWRALNFDRSNFCCRVGG